MPLAESVQRILVVDDEVEVREALGRILRKEKYEVATVPGGVEALALLAEDDFGLVITDLVMPGMDGLTLLREVRDAYPETRVLIMTAYGGWDSYLDAMNCGAFNYVTKPIKRDELLQQVRSAFCRTPGENADAHAPGTGPKDP